MFDFEELEGTGPTIDEAPLSSGDIVRVTGLTGAQHLNGSTGFLEKFDSNTGRWDVKLVGGEVKAIKPANLERKDVEGIGTTSLLMPGARVRLKGLSIASLNDQEGTCESFDLASGRWQVKLLSGQVKAIKPVNLVRDKPSDSRVVIPSNELEVRVCTWNLLAPCYHGGRRGVSEARTDMWQPRLKVQMAAALGDTFPDVLCLQEVYFSPNALRIIYEAGKEQGYEMIELRRTAMKQDGVAILVKTSRFEVVARQEQELCSIGNRVALWLLLKPKFDLGVDSLIVGTTHFTFPHDSHDLGLRLQQGLKTNSGWKAFAAKHDLDVDRTPCILSGDLNCEPGDAKDETLDVFFQGGWRSAFAESCGHEPGATHRTHNDESTCADFVLIRGAARATASALLPVAAKDSADMPRPEVGGATLLSSRNLPRTLSEWSQLSDHRPLVTTVAFQGSCAASDSMMGS